LASVFLNFLNYLIIFCEFFEKIGVLEWLYCCNAVKMRPCFCAIGALFGRALTSFGYV
jgi:hypothetical protein